MCLDNSKSKCVNQQINLLIFVIFSNYFYTTSKRLANKCYVPSKQNLIGALEYDIQTCVHIAINSFEEIYKSDKVEKICSDAIMKELKKKISVNDLKIKL